MKADNINISQEKLSLIEWITQLQDRATLKKLAKVRNESRSKEDQEVLDGIKKAVKEMNLYKEGKIELQSAREFLSEL